MPESRRVAAWLLTAGRTLWPVLVLLALAYVAGTVLGWFSPIITPVVVAVLLAAVLRPVVGLLERARLPRWLAAALVLLSGLAVLGGVLAFAVNGLITGLPDLQAKLVQGLEELRRWLLTGPVNLSEPQLDQMVRGVTGWVRDHADQLAAGATATASGVGALVSGLLLTVFTLFFLLYQGDQIGSFLLRAVPADVRDRARTAGERAFGSLSAYGRATLTVAALDALGVGIGLALIGVPLVVPLASLVLLGAFVPYIGAFVSGLAAILVALVSLGPLSALLVFLVVTAVQTLEGHVLQPLLLGQAVRLNPLAIVLAVSAGVVVAGIVGAVLAVPVLLVLRALVTAW
ncbi:AI-2E family transporter [Allokutzneria albata]|nr:AI-2E family transporter [Allokutzneria albata]